MRLVEGLVETAGVFAWPNRLTDVNSWHSHIPFANWCIETLRPGNLVELGTHRGDSYCAFCEAVDRLKLPTKCYAVDSWKGDHETGFYGEEVYSELQSYHDPRYARFSRLVRGTFDDAVSHFSDDSVDLLHLDGLHTYEAVRHDFETWLPKLSASAVALFHDINVREKDFGVWRYWQELVSRYPHFTFHHGHGLGVLVVGVAAPESARQLAACDDREMEQVRSFFARLGGGILSASRSQVADLRVDGLRGELDRTRAWANGLQQRVSSIEDEMTASRVNESSLRTELAASRAGADLLRSELAASRTSEDFLRNELAASRTGESFLRNELAANRAGEEFLHNELAARRVGEDLLRIELAASRAEEDLLRNELAASRAEEELLRNELAASRAGESHLRKELATSRAGEGALRYALAERGGEVARLQREAAAWRLLPGALNVVERLSITSSRRLRREAQIIARSGIFDADWYLRSYPDVAATKDDPLQHYLRFGAREGRNPHPFFDTRAYLERNPELAKSGVNPLAHSILNGTDAGEITLPSCGEPLVSIVIPVHGKAVFTHRCLASIASRPTRIPYEVIVVDDASPDGTATILAKVRHLRVVTNPTNLGYLRSCNAGAAVAKGRYIVLLNNDVEVGPEWLDALVDLAEADPQVGVVGAKLVYPDGTLQEAGGIIWSDGSGWNYGRNGDPERFEYNFVREVDYCSGACLLVRSDLLRQLGGYDERFAPAYYEDTDLCFAARAAGYRVLYQPRARIVHHEGISHGTDVSSGIKSYQEVNRRKFSEKWAAELADQAASGLEQVRRARDRRQGPGVLVIDHMVPTPDRDSGSLRMMLLLRALVDLGCRVRFLPQNFDRLEPYSSRLGQLGIEVFYWLGDVWELLRGLADDIELAIISRPTVAVHYMPVVRELLPGSKVMYDMVDFHGLRESRRSETCPGSAMQGAANTYRELEMALVRAADATIAVTEHERDLVLTEVPRARVHVIPNIHESPRSKAGFAERAGLLFVGSYQHPPNADAVLFFHDQILPLIRCHLPEVVLHLVGHPVPASIQALASPLVRVHGWVEDLSELHELCRVFVAPLRYGAGMKGKIGDSMIRGVPVVTTSIGAEGMRLTDGMDVLIADTPQAFANAVVRLYTDAALWKALAERGARHISENFGAAAATRRIAALLKEHGLAVDPDGEPYPVCSARKREAGTAKSG